MNENELIPYGDKDNLESFLKQPASKIAAAITGALAQSKADAILIAGRLVQSALKGKLFEQLGREINELIETGKIPEDYADKKYGFKSLSDMLEFIDSDVPDEDRFRAVKALFFSVIANSEDEKETIRRYSIFRLVRKLESEHWLILRAIYSIITSPGYQDNPKAIHANSWIDLIAEMVGHRVPALIENNDVFLEELRILSARTYGDKSGINPKNLRLTELGIAICELIDEYDFEILDK